ncbi:hypothetical protein MKX01_028867 [Papaver californicum]|nr:hypothetical protein MKX01_028867 [Papaver californicum]
MDEPTSGLDARAAAIVMRAVRNTVDTGRTVVCTIHQPSTDIFEAFDKLFLMKRGGEEIYVVPLGRHSCHLISYFEGIKGVKLYRVRTQDLFDAMGSMYAAVLFLSVENTSSVQPLVAVERTVFYRERAAGMYSALPYAFGQIVI